MKHTKYRRKAFVDKYPTIELKAILDVLLRLAEGYELLTKVVKEHDQRSVEYSPTTKVWLSKEEEEHQK